MTKVLEVHGDSDYSVVSYEDAIAAGVVNQKELFDKALAAGTTQTYEDDNYYFEYDAHEFGAVDQAFVDFIHNEIEDYDYAKHHTFFIVEEK